MGPEPCLVYICCAIFVGAVFVCNICCASCLGKLFCEIFVVQPLLCNLYLYCFCCAVFIAQVVACSLHHAIPVVQSLLHKHCCFYGTIFLLQSLLRAIRVVQTLLLYFRCGANQESVQTSDTQKTIAHFLPCGHQIW